MEEEDGITLYQKRFCEELEKRQSIEFAPIFYREIENPNPDMICGNCSYYKTPFCVFVSYQDVIQKEDIACVSFHFDRHLFNKKKRKQKRRLIPHGKR